MKEHKGKSAILDKCPHCKKAVVIGIDFMGDSALYSQRMLGGFFGSIVPFVVAQKTDFKVSCPHCRRRAYLRLENLEDTDKAKEYLYYTTFKLKKAISSLKSVKL